MNCSLLLIQSSDSASRTLCGLCWPLGDLGRDRVKRHMSHLEMRKKSFIFFTGSGTGSADHQQVQEVGTCEILEIRQEEPSRQSSEPCAGASPGSVWANENGVSRKGCLRLGLFLGTWVLVSSEITCQHQEARSAAASRSLATARAPGLQTTITITGVGALAPAAVGPAVPVEAQAAATLRAGGAA